MVMRETYSLLCELTGTLVLGVSEKLDNALLVWGKTVRALANRTPDIFRARNNVPSNLLDDLADESGALAQVTLGAGNSWLDNSSLGLLYIVTCISPNSVHHLTR
jgi:hypothetical protein